jgi:lipopolysaccharide/colanic/teichoic acid biosynthesis glycosyltransferase
MKNTPDFYETAKRLLDVAGAIFGLIIFFPLMLVVAFYIKLVSPGPVFADIPERVGKDSRKFRMYKFRSMIPNAHAYLLQHPKLYEEYKRNSYKLPNDPRIIRGGKFIRRSSIDELPQLINVLRGEMSLVGPRAYFPFELRDQQQVFPESRPYVERLLKIKPGITGPWQVGGRSEINFVERAKIDAAYADRRSILYDLLILLKTPLAVIQAKGAA